jgi:NADH-quinone oxidoreductase subunit K
MDKLLALLSPGIGHWLVMTSLLFSIGLYGVLSRRNAVAILMSVELLLNSAALSFVIFNRMGGLPGVDGMVMAVFAIAIAAAEVVVGMAIFVSLYRHRKTIDVNRLTTLKN